MPPKKKKEGDKPPAEEKFQQVDISTADPRTVVLMLDSPEAAVVCKACEALHKHAEKSEQNCNELNDLDTVPRLVRLVSSPDKATRSYAVLCLGVMASNGSVRRVLYRTKCVPHLMEVLKPEEEVISQERASHTIAELAGEYSFKVELLRHSAHEPLIKLLQSPDPDVQRNCLKALSLLVEHYQSRSEVREAGGLPVVMDMLTSEYPPIQELALKTLHSCMHDAGCRDAFREAGGLTKLVNFIGNKDYTDLHTLAMHVLALCLGDAENMVAIQSSGCLKQLLGHIAESTVPEMKKNAALALAKAAQSSVIQKILHEQEVEKTCIQLLSSNDDDVCIAGAQGLCAMAGLVSSKQVVGQEGGLGVLVGLLGKESGGVRAAAIQAVAQVIADAPANCKLVFECGGVEALVQLLGDAEAACRAFSADCIVSMAADESLRAALVSSGAVEALVNCLTSKDSSVQTSSSEAIGTLACDSSARDLLSSSGGVGGLLELLRSSSDAVRRSAMWALSVCALSREVAEEACRKGALDLVHQMCGSHSQLRGFAKAALSCLLDSNLSAKYWITGRLSNTDWLYECEFFDAGLAQSSDSSFVPLSDLVSQPLSLNRPVLTVNLLAKPAPTAPVKEPAPPTTTLDSLQSSLSVGRSKSRNATAANSGKESKTAKRGKGGGEREVESRVSEDSDEAQEKLPGLLAPDPSLWSHIARVKSIVEPMPSVQEQVEHLAKYVCECMGGNVQKTGTFGFELPAGEVQYSQQSNLLPLGEVKSGLFQHRALLFKVLCDQLGIGCSLVRGTYGRHWNEVTLMTTEGVPQSFVVDLMFTAGHLLPAQSPEAATYQHL